MPVRQEWRGCAIQEWRKAPIQDYTIPPFISNRDYYRDYYLGGGELVLPSEPLDDTPQPHISCRIRSSTTGSRRGRLTISSGKVCPCGHREAQVPRRPHLSRARFALIGGQFPEMRDAKEFRHIGPNAGTALGERQE